MIFDRAIRKLTNYTELVQTPMTLIEPTEWLTGITTGTTQSSAMKLSAVNACVECITNSISKLPIYVMDKNTKEHVQHPLLKVLTERPNEAMTPSVYKKLMQINVLMGGNGYALIIRDPTTAIPRELIPMHPSYIYPYVDDQGSLWYIFTHPRTGEVRKLSNFDVLHYKGYSEDGITGVSVLARAAEVINTSTAAQRYENKLYTQNARPSGVLKTPTAELNKAAKDKIRSEWDNIYSGADNAFRVAVLDMGLEYQQISLSNKDSQFVESKGISIEDISRFFGVPLYKINSGKQSYSSNEQNDIEYVKNTLHPIVTQCEEEDTYKLLFDTEKARGLEVRRNLMAELRGDTSSRGVWYKNMREMGAFSVNDVLALEDMPPVPGGDTRNASLNYIPLEDFKELSKNRNGGSE